jgi:ribonuclease HI
MIAYVDGGSRGNPGPAGIGVVVEHPTGRRVEISQSIGARDNNYAEYAALLVALDYAAAYQSSGLQVYSDSEVVVRQISGSYNCQSAALRDIYSACMALIGDFQHFAITHIRRENNAAADRLAKEAIDRTTREKQPADDDTSEDRFPLRNPRRLVQIEQPG